MSTYYTSDLHFHHKRICEFTERKLFTTPDEHTEWLIHIWNSTVRNQDKVFHLGDFSFSHKYEEVAAVVHRLKGQKFFIKGNHDRSEIFDKLKEDNLIQNWFHYKEIKVAGTTACLFHFPIASWHHQNHGFLMLHGHCHGSFKGNGKILDVGLDNAYNLFGEHKLFSEDYVLEYMQQQTLHIADSHRKAKD